MGDLNFIIKKDDEGYWYEQLWTLMNRREEKRGEERKGKQRRGEKSTKKIKRRNNKN